MSGFQVIVNVHCHYVFLSFFGEILEILQGKSKFRLIAKENKIHYLLICCLTLMLQAFNLPHESTSSNSVLSYPCLFPSAYLRF